MSTPPSSEAHGTWFCWLAVSYSAWKVCAKPRQFLKSVFLKPLAALATMKPLLCVVRSVTLVVNPACGSVIATLITSPGFSFSVWALGVWVLTLVSCGLGGPVGLPLVCRKAKLTGSWQFGFSPTKLNFDDTLSMFRAAHHWVALQLSLSSCGMNP